MQTKNLDLIENLFLFYPWKGRRGWRGGQINKVCKRTLAPCSLEVFNDVHGATEGGPVGAVGAS